MARTQLLGTDPTTYGHNLDSGGPDRHVVGRTSTNKEVYMMPSLTAGDKKEWFAQHMGFTPADHMEAYAIHNGVANIGKTGHVNMRHRNLALWHYQEGQKAPQATANP